MTGSLLLKNVFHEGRKTNILVRDGRFACLDAAPGACADEVVEADGMAILPAFYNTHTHAAMTLVRGYGDDTPLEEWLNEKIWPYEAGLTPDDIERGSKIAVREMIESGTAFFNDMYFDVERTIGLVDKAGMRAAIGITVMDNHSKAVQEEKVRMIHNWTDPTGGRISLVMAPHAVYTVGEERLRWCSSLARENGMKIHMHASETQTEVANCIRDHGLSPIRYLDSIGFLGPDVILAHCIWVDEQEWDILAERGVTVAHCPCSNMKIGSGRFPYELAIKSGVRVTLATDGASSNNNLDMREEAKFAALLAKVKGDPTLLPAREVLKWATVNGAEAFGIDAGLIEEGRLADFILVDLGNTKMVPCHDLVSNWIYSADTSCIKGTWCGGKKLEA